MTMAGTGRSSCTHRAIPIAFVGDIALLIPSMVLTKALVVENGEDPWKCR